MNTTLSYRILLAVGCAAALHAAEDIAPPEQRAARADAELRTALKVSEDNAPPVPPNPPEPPEPDRAPRPRPVKTSDLREMTAEVARSTRTMASRVSAEARAAADHARAMAFEFRDGLHRNEGNRTLVLPAGNPQPGALVTGHEELAVMSRILRKTMEKESRRGGGRGFAFSIGESGGNLDAMYLEGYGAVFLLNVDVPLTPPPKPEVSTETSADGDPTWERTKRELRGQEVEEGDGRDVFGVGSTAWTDGETQKYDAERVESLKRRLVDSLKHARNLSTLKDTENVTLIVYGKSSGVRTHIGQFRRREESQKDSGESGGTTVDPNIIGYVNTDSVRQSTLVLRARKSDILRFASGELKREEFTQAISISTF